MRWVLLNYPHSKNINLSLNNPDLYIQPSKDLTELKESKLKMLNNEHGPLMITHPCYPLYQQAPFMVNITASTLLTNKSA